MRRRTTPEQFYHVDGSLHANTPSYVQRQADRELLAHISAGDVCTVLTSRQTGKSSLKVRSVAALKKKRLHSVVIDLSGIVAYDMSAEAFYAGILQAFIEQLQLPVQLDQWWHAHALVSAVQRFTGFVTDEVMPRVRKRLAVFIDEIDSMLKLDFSDDFFIALRALYNDRALRADLRRLTFILLGAVAPQDLIKDRTRTPFNIGTCIELTDFTLEEACKLTEVWPLTGERRERCLARVLHWTGGQPYLTHKVCAELATITLQPGQEPDVDAVIRRLFFSDATWSDVHLGYMRDRMVGDRHDPEALLQLYRDLLLGAQVLDDERSPLHAALKLTGIARVFPGGMLRLRNAIYEHVFTLDWVAAVQRTRPDQQAHARPEPITRPWTLPTPTVSNQPAAQRDTLLQALETLEAQQRQLGLDFTLQMTELRRRLRDMPDVSQSGALAQGAGAVAAGERGVAVGGDVQGSTLITGSGNIVVGSVYTGAPTPDPVAALTIYRRVLVDSTRHLSLRSMDVGASDPTSQQQRFDLAQVYVDLHTTTQVPSADGKRPRRTTPQRPAEPERAESRPLTVLEAIIGHHQVVLLGDPGSGKSTVLTHLALCLAAHRLEPQGQWLARLTDWPAQEADSVPVLVILRDFAHWLQQEPRRAEPRLLWDFMVTRLQAQNLAFAAEALRERLEQGQAILLLDGLDEVPTAQQRTFIRDAVAAFAGRYTQCRIVVTCRTLSYQEPAWQLEHFRPFELAPFTAEQIDRFVVAWYAELARLGSIKRGAVAGVTRHLQQAVRRPDLWRLASNPLLLAVMALVHTHKGQLPEARALLYEETVDILLWRWEQVKASGEDDAPRLRSLLMAAGRTDVDLKRALWRLAFAAHREGGTADTEAVADIGELRLYQTLVELHPDKSHDWARQVVEVMQMRTGLLLERAPGVYTFPHRTFQEYLAGAYLSVQGDFARQASSLAIEGTFWREVVLLAVGRLVHVSGEIDKPRALLEELCPVQAEDTDVAWRQAWLAGDALLEMGRHRLRDSAAGRALDARLRQRLVDVLRAGRLRPVERAAVGDTLARLDDPRFRADAWYLPDEPLLGLVEIPAGPFMMGSDKTRDLLAYEREMPQHTLNLPRYYIARYPVTVAQFRAFVEASGHAWEHAERLQGQLNHPVVWVSWHDALAYCHWLTERLRAWEDTPEPLATLLRREGWCVTLPSEAEWEKAARGTDGRRYPWGNDSDSERANYGDTGIHTTSAVGCFPGGTSPYGVEELSGNVWEWTRSLWGEAPIEPAFRYPYDPNDGRENLDEPDNIRRVLRGDAFWDDHQLVRCAFRLRLDARYFYVDVGFRVVVAGRP